MKNAHPGLRLARSASGVGLLIHFPVVVTR
jgi:hypothetical protein